MKAKTQQDGRGELLVTPVNVNPTVVATVVLDLNPVW